MLRVRHPPTALVSSKNRYAQAAFIAREYDKGYATSAPRQNVQFNWPALVRMCRTILAHLAEVQNARDSDNSGNCIRKHHTDQFAAWPQNELVESAPLV